MVCPSCRVESQEGAKFCAECGTRPALACAACGTAYTAGQRFCAECGTPLDRGAQGAATMPARADEVVADRLVHTAGDMRLVSVLFVDLVGFTALSEGRDAEDVRELLGRHFEVARAVVGRYGGVIEKFIGDAVMAVWRYIDGLVGRPQMAPDQRRITTTGGSQAAVRIRERGRGDRRPAAKLRPNVRGVAVLELFLIGGYGSALYARDNEELQQQLWRMRYLLNPSPAPRQDAPHPPPRSVTGQPAAAGSSARLRD